jgi:hypothetical protein
MDASFFRNITHFANLSLTVLLLINTQSSCDINRLVYNTTYCLYIPLSFIAYYHLMQFIHYLLLVHMCRSILKIVVNASLYINFRMI